MYLYIFHWPKCSQHTYLVVSSDADLDEFWQTEEGQRAHGDPDMVFKGRISVESVIRTTEFLEANPSLPSSTVEILAGPAKGHDEQAIRLVRKIWQDSDGQAAIAKIVEAALTFHSQLK